MSFINETTETAEDQEEQTKPFQVCREPGRQNCNSFQESIRDKVKRVLELMPEITIDLIRRKAEHNEGLIHSLEELSLHQEELESINETLGTNCRRLKILYLQNNIIGEMRHLHHMKDLEYLNLALNNIKKVQGLHACEFLNKLDLTVNFVDLDELEESIDNLTANLRLRDLYMMGNPCQNWEGFAPYVTARLPQLERLDGREINRADRIRAHQKLPSLQTQLATLAEEVRKRKREDVEKRSTPDSTLGPPAEPASPDSVPLLSDEAAGSNGTDGEVEAVVNGNNREGSPREGDLPKAAARKKQDDEEEEELTKHTPEVRTAIYREMAEQKKEKEDRRRANLPRERDFEKEQDEAVARAREREAQGVVRQCNEGKLAFRLEEICEAYSEPCVEKGLNGGASRGRAGSVVLEVSVPRYLDSSLIDVDVHPYYVSVVIKGKILRLTLDTEVKASEAKAQRSKTTGSLVVTMPKMDPNQSLGLAPTRTRDSQRGTRRAPREEADRAAFSKNAEVNDVGRTRQNDRTPPASLASLMMQEAESEGIGGSTREQEEGGGGGGAGDTSPATLREGKPSQKAVSIRGMVGPKHGGLRHVDDPSTRVLEVASTKKRYALSGPDHGRIDTSEIPDESPDPETPRDRLPPPLTGEAVGGEGEMGVWPPPVP